MKFKKGDEIIVTIGKDKGRKGKIEKVLPKLNEVVIPGINTYKKHVKKRNEKQIGGIIEKVRSMAISKVALVCPKCGKMTRIGYEVIGTEKYRICKKCKQKI